MNNDKKVFNSSMDKPAEKKIKKDIDKGLINQPSQLSMEIFFLKRFKDTAK